MNIAAQRQAMWAWLFLVLLTVGAYLSSAGGQNAKILVLVISLGKVWIVGRYFMELNSAHPILRRIADIWLAITACVIFILFV